MANTSSTSKKTVTLDELESEVSGDASKDLDLLDGIDEDLESGSGRAWSPAADGGEGPGATLVGFVTAVYEVGSDYRSEPVPCVDVEDRDGEVWSVRGYHAALGGQLSRLKPTVGDAMAVKYIGEKQNSKGQQLQDYAVRVRRARS